MKIPKPYFEVCVKMKTTIDKALRKEYNRSETQKNESQRCVFCEPYLQTPSKVLLYIRAVREGERTPRIETVNESTILYQK